MEPWCVFEDKELPCPRGLVDMSTRKYLGFEGQENGLSTQIRCMSNSMSKKIDISSAYRACVVLRLESKQDNGPLSLDLWPLQGDFA